MMRARSLAAGARV